VGDPPSILGRHTDLARTVLKPDEKDPASNRVQPGPRSAYQVTVGGQRPQLSPLVCYLREMLEWGSGHCGVAYTLSDTHGVTFN
jgi:hypothetical protein